jgi:hypothetical protein
MKLRSTSLVLLTLFGVAIAAAISCRPAQAPATVTEDDGSTPTVGPDGGEEPEASAETHTAPSEGTADGGGTAALAEVLVTDPGEVQKIFDAAGAAPKASTKANGVTGPGPLAKGVRELAKTAATGMKADGPLITGKLEEKKNARSEVTLKPGKCYSIIGYSPKITDLDLYLLLPPGVLSGQDTTDDGKPVIAKAPDAMCTVGKTPVKYLLDIVADQGAGEFAVQVYSKAAAKRAAKKAK